MVLRKQNVRFVAIALNGFIKSLPPIACVPYLGSPQSVKVVHGMRRIFRTAKCLELREIHQHFGRSFRSGSHHEFHLHSVDRSRFSCFGYGISRWNNRNGSAGTGGSQAGAYGPLRTFVKRRRIHVRGAPSHGVACVDIFGDGFFHESFRRQYLRFAGLDVLFGYYSFHSSKVVDMGVRINHCLDRAFPCFRLLHFLIVKLKARFCRFC